MAREETSSKMLPDSNNHGGSSAANATGQNSSAPPPQPVITADEFFSIGSTVAIVNMFGHRLEGEVIAFDYAENRRVLALKAPTALVGGHPSHHDVHVLNLNNVKDIEIKKEAKESGHVALPNLNTEKVSHDGSIQLSLHHSNHP